MQDDKSHEGIDIFNLTSDGEHGRDEEKDYGRRTGHDGNGSGLQEEFGAASADGFQEEERLQAIWHVREQRRRQCQERFGLEESGRHRNRTVGPGQAEPESEEKSDNEEQSGVGPQSEHSGQGEEDALRKTDRFWELSGVKVEEMPFVKEDIVTAVCDEIGKSSCRRTCFLAGSKKRSTSAMMSCLVPLLTKYCLPKHLAKELEEERKILKRMDRLECSLASISNRIERLAYKTGGVCINHPRKHATEPELKRKEEPDSIEEEEKVEGAELAEKQVKQEKKEKEEKKEERREKEEKREKEERKENVGKRAEREEDECAALVPQDPCVVPDDSFQECVERMMSVESKLTGPLLSCSFLNDEDLDMNVDDFSDEQCASPDFSEDLARQLSEAEELPSSDVVSQGQPNSDVRSPSSVTGSYGPPSSVIGSVGPPSSVTGSVGPPSYVAGSGRLPCSVTDSEGPPSSVTGSEGPPSSVTASEGPPSSVVASSEESQTSKGESGETQRDDKNGNTRTGERRLETAAARCSDDYEPYLIKKPDGIPRSVQRKLAVMAEVTEKDECSRETRELKIPLDSKLT